MIRLENSDPVDRHPGFQPLARLDEIATAATNLVSNLAGNVGELIDGVTTDSRLVMREVRDLLTAAGFAARDLVRAAPRFSRIVRDILRIAAAYRVHDSVERGAGGLLGADTTAALRESLNREGAERLYRLCIDLRGGVLKFGQFLSTRRDLLPAAYVEQLSLLQDRVPPVRTADLVERIVAELGEPLDRLFPYFDDDCLAAASLAQVHAAHLPDGSRVAVKVQVPGIEEIVETDIAAMRLVVPMIRDLLPPVDIDTVLHELGRATRDELDYRAECRNAEEFAEFFAGDPDVIIPAVYRERTAARVLTLEYIEGERLTDFLDACEQRGEAGAADRDRILTILLRSTCAQVLTHGSFHADPHPGNFLVVSGDNGPRLAILDFGNVQRFSADRRRAYAQLGFAILGRNASMMTALLDQLGFRNRGADRRTLEEFADLLLEPFREGSNPYSVDPRERFERALELTRANPVVQIPADFVQLGRVFGSIGGLMLRYQPRVDLFQTLMPYLATAMA